MNALQQKDWMQRLLDEARNQRLSDADVARRLGVSRQTFSSWKERGLPLRRLDDAARALGMSLEYLKTGLRVARHHHALTEEQRSILEDLSILDDEDRKRLTQPIREEAKRIRRYLAKTTIPKE